MAGDRAAAADEGARHEAGGRPADAERQLLPATGGAPLADIPARYGPHTTCVSRINRWRRAGHGQRLLEAVSQAYNGDLQMIGPSSIRVQPHAASGSKKEDPVGMGRSRGGLTTKVHALVDANGMPIALKLTAGHVDDGRSAADMLDTLGKGDILLADRAYDSHGLRIEMAARGAWTDIKPCRTANSGPRSAPSSIATEISSSASSTSSSSSRPSPPATTTSSHRSRSHPFASGRDIMSEWPRHGSAGKCKTRLFRLFQATVLKEISGCAREPAKPLDVEDALLFRHRQIACRSLLVLSENINPSASICVPSRCTERPHLVVTGPDPPIRARPLVLQTETG